MYLTINKPPWHFLFKHIFQLGNYLIVKSKNMWTVSQRTTTPPPLARIVSSPL